MLLRILLAIEPSRLRRQIHGLIASADTLITSIAKNTPLLEKLSREGSDLVIVSRALLPEPLSETVRIIASLPDSPSLVVITDREDSAQRARLLADGCSAVLCEGLATDNLKDVLATILTKRRETLVQSIPARISLGQPSLNDFISTSPAMQAFMNIVRRVVSSDSSILILGETGVGKERLAHAVHAQSHRGSGPFIAVNCGALPDTLLESELFGHEQGAFTGATRARRGWFELAHRGTIFLDEIGEMPAHLQVKLLRVLQEKRIQRVGSERHLDIDVRIMAASNRDLADEVAEKRFRRDLYYRLCVVTLQIPPLRERVEDIPLLIDSYIDYLRPRIGREVYNISAPAREALCQYTWPGNVRELINVIERAMLLCSGEEITPDDLPPDIAGTRTAALSGAPQSSPPADTRPVPAHLLQCSLQEAKKRCLDNFERLYFTGLLQQTGGRIGETARCAGIQPRSLYDKMKRLGLRKEDFRKTSS